MAIKYIYSAITEITVTTSRCSRATIAGDPVVRVLAGCATWRTASHLPVQRAVHPVPCPKIKCWARLWGVKAKSPALALRRSGVKIVTKERESSYRWEMRGFIFHLAPGGKDLDHLPDTALGTCALGTGLARGGQLHRTRPARCHRAGCTWYCKTWGSSRSGGAGGWYRKARR
jgi:hypothetical protein